MSAIQHEDISAMMQKFRAEASGKSASSRLNYAKAINCLETFLGTYTYSHLFPSDQTLADWMLNMRSRGISGKTAIHYLDIISALYKDIATESNPDSLRVFGQFKARARQVTEQSADCPIDDKIFKKVLSITKTASSSQEATQCAADILLFSLLNRAMPLKDVARVKVSDIDSADDTLSLIIKRNAAANRKYLFPLGQSSLTPKQLVENAERRVRGLFIANRIPVVKTLENSIRLIWAYAALRCGIPGSEIIALLGSPVSGLPELWLCSKADIDPGRQDALTATVNTLFADNPLRWYAMKLRSRIAFDEIEQRINSLDARALRPELFYPYDEIRRRVGKKLIKDRQPVIRDIVFFRQRVTDIFPLFCKIGDLAWCYTTTGRPGGDYAPIPRASFERFQETIGHFTPDYEIAPIGGFEPTEGETVVILNGPLSSYEFEVDKAKIDNANEGAGNVIFQLNMIGNNGFQWRTTANRRQLTPSPTK